MCGRKSKICCEHIINLAQIAHRLKHDPFFLLSNFQHVALFVMKTIKFDLSGRVDDLSENQAIFIMRMQIRQFKLFEIFIKMLRTKKILIPSAY